MSISSSDKNIYNNLIQNDEESSGKRMFRRVQSVKKFLKSMNLNPAQIKYNHIFKNDSNIIMAFINIYLRCKVVNILFFALFLFFASTSFIYSLFHIKYNKQNISGRIGHIITEFSFTVSLILILLLGIINFHRFGLFNIGYYKSFLVSFFVYTFSILFFRKYNQTAHDEENQYFQYLFYYCFLAFFIISIIGMFISFSMTFRPFHEVQLCSFTDNSKLPVWYFCGFVFCAFITANLVQSYF